MFKAGDLARLNSGGPLMTVTKVAGKTVSCIWFAADNTVLTGDFAEVLLQKINS